MQGFWLIFAHFIGDYALQSTYLATTKGSNLWNLFAHSMLYSGSISMCFKILGKLTMKDTIVITLSHMIIDYLKCKVTAPEYQNLALAVDQLLHNAINFGLFYFG